MQKSYHYIGLLKAVMRLSMTALKAADAKEVSSSVTAITNEKLKAEKEVNAGKKRTGIFVYSNLGWMLGSTFALIGLVSPLFLFFVMSLLFWQHHLLQSMFVIVLS